MNPDLIREAIQKVLDFYGDGWTVAQFVVAMSLERLDGEEIDTAPWVYAPKAQPDWMTEKLLEMAEDMQRDPVNEDLDP